MNEMNVLSVKGVSKRYGDFNALKDVSFDVKEKKIFGLLGSNGAGKSTLLHIIIGLLNPSKGQVEIFEENISISFPKRLKRHVAIVPQKISLYSDLTIYQNLYFFAKAYGYEKEEIEKKIKNYADILKLGDTSRKIKNLSGGYKRRTSLAVGLIGDPRLLILDEALVGIDLETKKIIVDLLNALKKQITIIITTHSIREAQEMCDDILFLHRGQKILEGRTRDVIKRYSQKEGSVLKIFFNSKDVAKNVHDLLDVSRLGITEKSLENEMVHLKVRHNKQTKKDPVVGVLDWIMGIPGTKDAINDIEINKPTLEDVMLGMIR